MAVGHADSTFVPLVPAGLADRVDASFAVVVEVAVHVAANVVDFDGYFVPVGHLAGHLAGPAGLVELVAGIFAGVANHSADLVARADADFVLMPLMERRLYITLQKFSF